MTTHTLLNIVTDTCSDEGRTGCGLCQEGYGVRMHGTVNVVASRCIVSLRVVALESFVNRDVRVESSKMALHARSASRVCIVAGIVDFCSREWNIFRRLRPQEECVQNRDTNSWMGIDSVYLYRWCNATSLVFCWIRVRVFASVVCAYKGLFCASGDLVLDYRRRTFGGLCFASEASALEFLYEMTWKICCLADVYCANVLSTLMTNLYLASQIEVCFHEMVHCF